MREAATRLAPGNLLRAARRALVESTVERRDREDHERLRALMSEVVERDSCCVDVGAHEGVVLAEMARLAPEGRHVAFEPLPELAARLAERFPQIDVHAAALSDRSGTREFVHVRSRPGWSGFLERPYPGRERVERITVPVETLDEALPDDLAPALVKIDVEGAEREVLAGAIQTLVRHRPLVVFEHGVGSADYYGTEPRHVWELLVDQARLRIFNLDGEGPYSLERLEREFSGGVRVNFVARR